MTGTDWSHVRRQVASLARQFGVCGDRRRRGVPPPLSPAELAEVEAQVEVELPEEYRSYLLQISRGGVHPLPELRRVDGRWRWLLPYCGDDVANGLDRPFPHTEAWNWPDSSEPEPLPEDYPTQEEYEAAEREWWRDKVGFADEWAITQGTLVVHDRGCGFQTLLVVSGAARGTMWFDDRCVDGPVRPVLDDAGRRVGFARWYRRYLAEHSLFPSFRRRRERWSASG
ncbi:SMI1/KNR4 family protein [Micromonospora yasonensis]|uniref:SMI1/KNR4 family protein n=1 Tax=Micromonospora yasonensis TaxID=1128667 RepID=UPI00223113B1|nr:SMI1/KNR4 family protein [Micromonospora yasonensis]MCW3840922.1 SMI1/KNR4 family protein [Micromonospora yasonensis]